MKTIFFLVVLANTFYASVKCADSSGFGYEILLQEIEQLKLSQQTLQKELEEFKQKTSTLQNQLEALQKQPDVKWVSWYVNQTIPQNAVFAGYNWDNIPMYVGRVRHNGDDTVVKVCPTIRGAFLSYGGNEIRVDHCEVLTGTGFSWAWDSNGHVPENAVLCGKQKATGVPHYIGRAHHYSSYSSSLTPGTINGEHGRVYIPFGGKEYSYADYQVLVRG